MTNKKIQEILKYLTFYIKTIYFVKSDYFSSDVHFSVYVFNKLLRMFYLIVILEFL